ncbi:saccharopine dehydrogenase family protein [Vannielia sp. SX4]|uniref:saccharopine dehydrogenase family protein n=1 Tax=Vannielia sp. SX4 TaxID=3463852 RepID=UPI004059DEBD
MTIHWCGTGLSAIPGLRRLLAERDDVTVWNRTEAKAREAVGDLTDDIRAFSMEALAEVLAKGDLVVSMLPGDHHVPLAELCLAKGADFVSSSYISPEMRALDAAAKEKGLRFVNEVGLDPGIDHLMAHWLMADYRASEGFSPDNVLNFISYCGGIPKEPNAFRYKFSWSPLGVLKALKSPSVSIRSHSELRVSRPWDALSRYDAPLSTPESFEVYPNRDSLPFMAEYGFEPGWKVKDFVRGTLRLNGWSDAWKDVFAEVEALEGKPELDARLAEMAAEFWEKHAYDEGEPDRVVLCVALEALKDGVPVYHKTYAMDAWGDARGSAMARLVSDTVALAVEAVLAREIAPGVSAAPSDPRLVERWLDRVHTTAQHLMVVDHLS